MLTVSPVLTVSLRPTLQKLSTHKSNLSSLQIEHQSLSTSSAFLTSRVEDLALLNAKLEEAARADDEEKRRLQDEAEEIMSALRKEEEERDEDAEKWAREREELEAVRPLSFCLPPHPQRSLY